MTYAQGRVINDADSHIMETREWLDPFMDDDLKARLKPLYGREPGRIDKLLESDHSAHCLSSYRATLSLTPLT